MSVTVVGSASAAATSVAIPAHQAGDVIVIAARGTTTVTSPAAGGTVPIWVPLQAGLANSLALNVCFATATGSGHTSGVWPNASHISVLVLRPDAGRYLDLYSSLGNGNNTLTIVYPALTLQVADGSSFGVRVGSRTVAASQVATPPSGWTFQTQAGGTAIMALHTRAGLAANPTADSVSTPGTNAAYRAVTIEVVDRLLSQTRAVAGVGSPAAFSSTLPVGRITVVVGSVYPSGFTPSITGQVISGDGHLVGGSVVGQFGAITTTVHITTRVDVGGVGTAQNFGLVTVKTATAKPVAGLASAQAFGTVTVKTLRLVPVSGVASAAAFGTTLPIARITRAVAGIPSAQQFGAIITRTGFSQAVGGVSSAQAFGPVKTAFRVSVSGLDSAQTFGQVRPLNWVVVSGVASAQEFGTATVGLKARNVWIWPTEWVSSVQESPICGQVICGDGHLVGGWEYLPASGTPDTLVLDPSEVETLVLVPTVSK